MNKTFNKTWKKSLIIFLVIFSIIFVSGLISINYLNDVVIVKDNKQNVDDNLSKDDLVNRLNDLKNK